MVGAGPVAGRHGEALPSAGNPGAGGLWIVLADARPPRRHDLTELDALRQECQAAIKAAE